MNYLGTTPTAAPVIGIISDEKIASKTLSNLIEVKSRGAKVIVLTTLPNIGNQFKEVVYVPNINVFINPMLMIIPLQLIAYEVAKIRGCDIDKPKNLAKSVTVE